MGRAIPRAATRLGTVATFARERGVDHIIRKAVDAMFRPDARADAALRIGAVDVFSHPGLRTTGAFFKFYVGGRPVGIFLNPRWFRDPEALRRTFLHEVAHAAVYLADQPGNDHGPAWRGFMEALGLEPRPCHREHDLVEAFWAAYCPACGLALDHVRRVRRPRRNYTHATCLVAPGEVTVEWRWVGPQGKS